MGKMRDRVLEVVSNTHDENGKPIFTEQMIEDYLSAHANSIQRWQWTLHNNDHYTREDELKSAQNNNGVATVFAGQRKAEHIHLALEFVNAVYYSAVAKAFGLPEGQVQKPLSSYLEGLESELKAVEKALDNLIKALENGYFGEKLQDRMTELEARKKALAATIATERIKREAIEDEHTIYAYFQKFLNANLDDPEIRNTVLEGLVDKIFLYDGYFEITGFYSNDRTVIEWDEVEDGEIEYSGFIEPADEFADLADGSTNKKTHPEGWVFLLAAWRGVESKSHSPADCASSSAYTGRFPYFFSRLPQAKRNAGNSPHLRLK